MTRRRTARLSPEDFLPSDPIDGAVMGDREAMADELAAVLKALEGVDDNRVTASIFRMPDGGLGKFQWLEDISAPFDVQAVRSSLKAKYGGGKYRLQIFVDRITRKNVEMNIAGDAIKPASAPTDSLGGSNLMAMMMHMQAESRRDSMEQQRFMMEQQSKRDAMMMQTLGVVVPVLAPLLFGNREKLADVVAMMNANKSEPTNLKDTIETVVLLKKAFGDGDKSADFNPDDIVGSLARLAGPVIGAAGRLLPNRAAPADQVQYEAGPENDGGLHLPPPSAAAPAAPGRPAHPLVAMIRPHVLYFFSTDLDPGLAAEAIVDIMSRQGVTDGDVNELVAAYSLSPDWKHDLASQGLDLRGNPEWADAFLGELVAAWTQRDRDGDAGGGGSGSVANAPHHAEAGAPGLALDADTGTGA